jgi:hypothetical protein
VVHRGVDEVHAADEVALVVEAPDEVAQALGGVGGEVEDEVEAVLVEEPIDEPASRMEPETKAARSSTLPRKPPERSSSATTGARSRAARGRRASR